MLVPLLGLLCAWIGLALIYLNTEVLEEGKTSIGVVGYLFYILAAGIWAFYFSSIWG